MSLNRVTLGRLDTEVVGLIGVVDEMAGNAQALGQLAEVFLNKAVYGDASLYAQVASEVLRGVENERPLRKEIHDTCEACFSQHMDDDLLLGLCQYIAYLYRFNVMSVRIVHTCIITCLLGASIDKAHTPSPSGVIGVCDLLAICGPYMEADPKKVHYYITRLETIAGNYPTSVSAHIDELLHLYRNDWTGCQNRMTNVLKRRAVDV
ncbi:hypothetical protein DIPPA_09500 [Diplonema papillatum]|nr:hypothetical protein DIPPA_09500 [Diplonema papillatum]